MALRQVINLPAALLVVDHQNAVGIELLQDRAGRRGLFVPVPAPMHGGVPEDLPLDGQAVAGGRALFPDPGQGLLLQLRKAGERGPQRPAPGPVGGKAGPVLRGPDGQLLVGISRQQPVLIQEFAAEIHGVELDAARLADVGVGAVLPEKAPRADQPLLYQQEAPRLFFGDGRHVRMLPTQFSRLMIPQGGMPAKPPPGGKRR